MSSVLIQIVKYAFAQQEWNGAEFLLNLKTYYIHIGTNCFGITAILLKLLLFSEDQQHFEDGL